VRERCCSASYQASDDQLKAEAFQHRAAAELGLRQADVRHRLGLAAGIAVTAIALLLVALALLRSTLLPVARLTRAAEELAAGHPVSLPYGDRRDEVGRLAGSLRSWQQTAAEDKSVFEHAPIGICRIAPNGKLLNANPALLQILQLERDQLPLLWFPAFTANPDPDAWKLIRESQLVTERAYASGEGSKWCRVTVASVPGERADDAYWVGMLEDVTVARTQAEQLPPPGRPRQPHRAAQSPALPGPSPPGSAWRRPIRSLNRPSSGRPRWLQGRQRRTRPPGR